jgi:site-specific DNA recombinase
VGPKIARDISERKRAEKALREEKSGWQRCPSKSIPAAPIEELVLAQIHQLGREPQLLHQVLAQVRHEDDARLAEMETERGGLERDLVRSQGELRKLLAEVGAGTSAGGVVSRLAQLQQRVGQIERRIARLRTQIEAVQQERLDEAEATRVLAGLDPAWASLTPEEQARVIRLLVSRVDYDGAQGKVSITFHPLGLKTLAGEWLGQSSEEHSA